MRIISIVLAFLVYAFSAYADVPNPIVATKFVRSVFCDNFLGDIALSTSREGKREVVRAFLSDYLDFQYLNREVRGNVQLTAHAKQGLLDQMFGRGDRSWVNYLQNFQSGNCEVQVGSTPPLAGYTIICATVSELDKSGRGPAQQARLCFEVISEKGGGCKFQEITAKGHNLIKGLARELKSERSA